MTGEGRHERVEGLYQFIRSSWPEYHYVSPHMVWDNPIFPPRDRPVEVPYVPGALHTAAGRAMVGVDKPWWLEQMDEVRKLIPDRAQFERVLQEAKRRWVGAGRLRPF
ncbi:hypothetical protein SEA_SPEEDDEMON_590 [Gordonia phage SpeedDemon]|nr:hypothetical protein SEA_SPEEDDEMON_590 [Gordonia phage SpeedDemon]